MLLEKAEAAKLAVYSPYKLVDVNSGRTLLRGDGLEETKASFHGAELILGGERFRTAGVKVVSRRDGAVELNGVRYRGEVSLVEGPSNQLKAVNRLNIEGYIQGVLGSEMPGYWGKEALMAQAICARTYALYRKIVQKDLNSLHLAYRGTAKESWRLNKIVAETRGIVMFYEGKMFSAYFHSTCGGRTEDAAHVFGDKGILPLSGVKCGFCDRSRYYRWEVDIGKADLEKKLGKAYPGLKGLSSVVPVSLGPGGHSATVRIRHTKGDLKIGANEFRLLVGPNTIFSTAFSTQDQGRMIRFTGSGWGHGVGLCQYGAQKMAEEGYQWFEILKHYYPGVEFVKVYR
ncbi:MAG: SpoIID/LytB domain-containing protein [Candidatus Brocadiales bacterium]